MFTNLIAPIIITALAAGVPIAVIALVSLASTREDAQWTLGGPPPGRIQATARRILGFHARGRRAVR